ncbi:MAG: aurora kinase A-interacting protein [Acidimicrobiales bacterium]|nr:aurora kinase A-interacting protein [Acidimicrobiia bacterium]MBT8215449.1 aurora kinase A-interacting protein [Acidimicrobiia bacterium]NNF56350.1 aurora kinase A-interacting protein [Acidimicrobiales bacterium]NNL69435.1 aurora kinase A-interacting protein [Acidimicrobiia bacterium]
MGSLVKKRRKKMSKHKYRKRLRANRHKRKKK